MMVTTRRKPSSKDQDDYWSLGIDPGYGTTALVLMKNDVPVAAAASGDKSTYSLLHRTRRLRLWVVDTTQCWINTYGITELHVVIELAYLNNSKRSVLTLAAQMRMIGVYEDALYDLQDCTVSVGEVVNTTAKLLFTGHGNAAKPMVIAKSVWAKRPDLEPFREHLADAQAIGSCGPIWVFVDPTLPPRDPIYSDGNIGHGPKWKGKL